MLGENSSPPFPGRYHMAAASIRRREIAGNSIQRARRVEMESIARRVVLPLIKEKCETMNARDRVLVRSEEHTSELQSLMRISYAVFCLKKKKIIEKAHV